jgi:hypothetical protein
MAAFARMALVTAEVGRIPKYKAVLAWVTTARWLIAVVATAARGLRPS